MLLRSVIVGTAIILNTLQPSSNAAIQEAAIPLEDYNNHLKRLLPPEEIADSPKEYLVRFLPGDCVGGMSHPYLAGKPDAELFTTLQTNLNVRTIITLTTVAIPKEFTCSYPDITFIHVPIVESPAFPLIESLKTILIQAQDSTEESRLVMHCYQGRGRTGAMLAAILYLTTGYTMDNVIAYIRATRPGAIDYDYHETFLKTLEATIEARHEETRVQRFFAAIVDGSIK